MARTIAIGRTRSSIAAPALLLLLSLLARGLVPAGYMVASGSTGWPRLVLCSGTAAKPSAAPQGRHHGQRHRHDDGPAAPAESPCAFAALLAPALPPAPPILAEPAIVVPAVPAFRPVPAAFRPALAAPPPPARGPPPIRLA
jgi:hypothetical protein